MTQNQLAVVDRGATFSDDKIYRYHLWRRWGPGTWLCWILLNPSTADAVENDPTVERCERRAKEMGHGGVSVLNLFALRATDPSVMLRAADPAGPENDGAIRDHAKRAARVVCAWGVHGSHRGRGETVVRMLQELNIPLYRLGATNGGHPIHPLYVPYQTQPHLWEPRP